MFIPSKLLIAGYMIGGCALGCLLEPILDHTKQPSSGAMVAGILAVVLVLALANVWMYRKAARQPDSEFPTGLWERYANAVTASASFVLGFLLIISAVVFR